MPLPSAGRTFTGERIVRLGDVSPAGRLRLDAVARYLQDIATDDAVDAGSTACTTDPKAPPVIAPRNNEGANTPPDPPEPSVIDVATTFANSSRIIRPTES